MKVLKRPATKGSITESRESNPLTKAKSTLSTAAPTKKILGLGKSDNQATIDQFDINKAYEELEDIKNKLGNTSKVISKSSIAKGKETNQLLNRDYVKSEKKLENLPKSMLYLCRRVSHSS